jgi:hypothetical protein
LPIPIPGLFLAEGWTRGRNMKKLKAGIKRGVEMVSPKVQVFNESQK